MIHKGSAESLESSDHYREGSTSLCDNLVSLVWQIGDTNR
jgi:hypothetical protein